MSGKAIDFDGFSSIDGNRIAFADGGVIFIKGDPGDCAFVVVNGTVEIREGGRTLETVQSGEMFGEMALIEPEARVASAVAVGSTELTILDRPEFERLVYEEQGFAVMVMRLMARRLRATLAASSPETGDLPVAVLPREAG